MSGSLSNHDTTCMMWFGLLCKGMHWFENHELCQCADVRYRDSWIVNTGTYSVVWCNVTVVMTCGGPTMVLLGCNHLAQEPLLSNRRRAFYASSLYFTRDGCSVCAATPYHAMPDGIVWSHHAIRLLSNTFGLLIMCAGTWQTCSQCALKPPRLFWEWSSKCYRGWSFS